MNLRRHLLLAAIALLVGVARSEESTDGCVEDALVCPNGVALSRDPLLNCNFPACPAHTPKTNKHLKGEKATAHSDEQAQAFSF